MTAAEGEERLPLYRAKIVHLEALIADLDHDWERLPRLFATTVLAIPVGIVHGLAWGFVTVVLACCFVGVVAYITGVRKRDYMDERTALHAEIAKVERAQKRAHVDEGATLG
jgi:hypothetical protein